jgi:hypothetical protein
MSYSDNDNDSDDDHYNDDAFNKERLEALLLESDSDSNTDANDHNSTRSPVATTKLSSSVKTDAPVVSDTNVTTTAGKKTELVEVHAVADAICVDSLASAEQYENALLNVTSASLSSKPVGPLAARRKRSFAQSERNSGMTSKPRSPTSATVQGGAQVVQTRVLRRLGSHLQRNAQANHTGHGLPTAIAVHSRFIAIGTSRAKVLIFDHNVEAVV